MVTTVVLVAVAAAVCGVIAGAIMTWASRRSPLWNMAFALLLGLAAVAAAFVIAWIMTRRAYPN